MDKEPHSHHSQLFTLRLWLEETSNGRSEWRGQVRHVTSGKARYFRDWPTLILRVLEMLGEPTADPSVANGAPKAQTGRCELFVVRLWWEAEDKGSSGEWRGRVDHVSTQERRYFREIENVVEFIHGRLAKQQTDS